MPPCPGILSPKSLTLKARLKPEAKKPPNGATSEAKMAITMAWNWKGAYGIDVMEVCNCGGRTQRSLMIPKRSHVCISEQETV